MEKAINLSGELKGEGVGEWLGIVRRTEKLSALMGPHAASPASPDAIIEAAVGEVPEVQEAEKRVKAIRKEIELLESWFQRRISDEEIQRKLKTQRLPTREDLERRRRVLEEWEQELEKRKASLREEFKNQWGDAAEAIFRAIKVERRTGGEELEVHMIAPPEGMTWAQLLELVRSNPESFSLRVWLVTPYGRTLETEVVKQFAGTLTFTRSGEEGKYDYDVELNFKEPEEPAEPEMEEPSKPKRKWEGEADVTKIPPLPKIGRSRDDWGMWGSAAKKLREARALLGRLWEEDPEEAELFETQLGEIGSQLFGGSGDVMSIIEQIEEIIEEIKAKLGEKEEEDVEEVVEAPPSDEEDIREKLGAYISALYDAGRKSEASALARRLRRTTTLEGLRKIYNEVIRQALEDKALHQIAVGAGLFDGEERIEEEVEDDTERAAGGALLRLVLLRKCSQFVSTYYRRRRQDVDTGPFWR
jgi:predicted DNA-binding protein YlxM (UPF0122 family)